MVKRMVSFSKPSYQRLTREATRLGVTVSEVVRRAVDKMLDGKPAR